MASRWSMRQESHYSLRKRARFILSRLFGTRLQDTKNLYFVTMNGRRFKRLILRDSYLASEIERSLERFGASEHFPPLVIRYENEIWVEFVRGTSIQKADERIVEMMADFFATVYTRRPQQVEAIEAPYLWRLQQDLCFLNQVGVLADGAYRELDAAAERLIPKQVWVGFDYTDAKLDNFVITEETQQVCAVDVESLRDNQLMGIGVAKACVRWLEPFRKVFFDHLARKGVPAFQPYFPFVELCVLANWATRGFFEKKWRFVDPTRFDRFRHL